MAKENKAGGDDEEKPVKEGKGRKRGKGPTFKVGGVMVNAKSLSAAMKELEPLDQALPSDPEHRANWHLDAKLKAANFDCEWTSDDDSRLLRGIYAHGMGSWEAIKMDSSLKLGDKILPNDSKPQIKQLNARAEYLLKVLKKQIDAKLGVTRVRKPRKPKEVKTAITKEIIEDDSSADENKKPKPKVEKQPVKKEDEVTVKREVKEESDGVVDDKKKDKKVKRDKKEAKKNKKSKQAAGPMHFTANNEPRALDVLGDLDPSIFNECKEKMRPVKKALKALDRPDQTLSEADQVAHTRQCLVQIGNQINTCLSVYRDPEQIKEWRSNLWYFVSKFTEFDAKKLYKLYKHATRKGDDGTGGVSSSPEKKEETSHSKKHTEKSHDKTHPSETASKEARSAKRRVDDVEENSNNSTPSKKHLTATIAAAANNAIGSCSTAVTIGGLTITPLASTPNSTSSVVNSVDPPRHKEPKDPKHKEAKRERDRDRDRERERSHGGDRSMDRLSGTKDERVRRDSGGYAVGGHYSGGSREEDHWLARDVRDPRDSR